MNFEFNKKNIILLTIFILVIITSITINNYRKESPRLKETEKISLVSDYSRFFTISNAGNKYINYLKNKDIDNILILLSDDYITVNNINKNNILQKIKFIESGEYSFEAQKMYQEPVNKNIIRYYIYGLLNKEMMDDLPITTDYYLIIDLDIENSLFSVTPYNGEIFKEDK